PGSSTKLASNPMPESVSMRAGAVCPVHSTVARRVERLTRASLTSGSAESAFSTLLMQPPQCMPGTERLVRKRSLPRFWLASTSSLSPVGAAGGVRSMAASTLMIGLPSLQDHLAIGVPCGVAEQREDDDEPDER